MEERKTQNQYAPTRTPTNLRTALAPKHLAFLVKRMGARRRSGEDFNIRSAWEVEGVGIKALALDSGRGAGIEEGAADDSLALREWVGAMPTTPEEWTAHIHYAVFECALEGG